MSFLLGIEAEKGMSQLNSDVSQRTGAEVYEPSKPIERTSDWSSDPEHSGHVEISLGCLQGLKSEAEMLLRGTSLCIEVKEVVGDGSIQRRSIPSTRTFKLSPLRNSHRISHMNRVCHPLVETLKGFSLSEPECKVNEGDEIDYLIDPERFSNIDESLPFASIQLLLGDRNCAFPSSLGCRGWGKWLRLGTTIQRLNFFRKR